VSILLTFKKKQRNTVMKKSLLQISVLCAASSMLVVSAWAQSATSENKPMTDQNSPPAISADQNNRSWSTKHLSATGRNGDTAVRGSRLVGAQVNDSNGQRAGQIQDIIVNPVSGRIDFALLSSNASQNPGNSGKMVPVPWSLLRARASAQYGSSAEPQPEFTLNCNQSKLGTAPTVDLSDLNQSEWRQRVYSYYGVTPQSSMDGAETPAGEVKGEGALKLQQETPSHQPDSQQPQVTPQPPSNP
jgi:sporulation protein YlmC with PRC-barrel domain